MIQPNLTYVGLAALALGACQRPADETNITIDNGVNAAEAAAADIEALPPSESGGAAVERSSGSDAADAAAAAAGSAAIPAQYHGRWGMVAADCTSTRGDNKGLITIGDSTLKFYESTATLKERRPAIATSFSALYGFTGEGQNWEKVVTLTRTGDTLTRADDEGSYTYTRC